MPNVQAQIDQTSTFYLNQGVLGATVVLLILFLVIAGLVIRTLYRENQSLHTLVTTKLGEALVAYQASTGATAEMRSTILVVKGTVDVLATAVSELSHENEKSDQEVRHGLANISASLNSIATLLGNLRGKAGA